MSISTLLESFAISLPVRGASPLLKDAVRRHDETALDHQFRSHLRTAHKRLRKLCSRESLLCMWSVDSVHLSGRERELAVSIEEAFERFQSQNARSSRPPAFSRRRKRSQSHGVSGAQRVSEVLNNWLVEALCPLGAWEILAVGELLIRFASQLDPELRKSCLALFLEHHQRRSPAELRLSDSPAEELHKELSQQPYRYKFLEPLLEVEAELLLNLAVQPFINDTVERKEAVSVLTQTLMDCTDEDGVIQGNVLSVLPHLLAPWTRMMVWSSVFEQSPVGQKVAVRYRALIEKCAMLMLPSRQLAVPLENVACGPEPGVLPPNVWEMTAIGAKIGEFRGRGKVRTLLKEIETSESPARTRRQLLRRMKSGQRPQPARRGTQAWQSDSSAVAMIRSSADMLADVCSVDWSGSAVRLCLAAFGCPVLNGSWTSTIEVDEHRIEESSAWDCTCWYMDEAVAFAEIERKCEVCTHVRHVMVSTTDRFAILTDSVRACKADRQIQMNSAIKTHQGGQSIPDKITRELRLVMDDVAVRVFPLWLPDDRIDFGRGQLRHEEETLQCSIQSVGGATMPIVVDWHPFRSQQPADWTRLTVAESRRIVADAEATGYRLRIGIHQLMAYLSLVKPLLNRTVLGVHTPDESFYGRVEASGDLDPFVQVEARAEDSSDE